MSTLTGMILTLRDIPPSPTSRTVAPTASPRTMPPSSTGSPAATGIGATGVIARVRILGEGVIRATLLGGLKDVWDQVSANDGMNSILSLSSHSHKFSERKKRQANSGDYESHFLMLNTIHEEKNDFKYTFVSS